MILNTLWVRLSKFVSVSKTHPDAQSRPIAHNRQPPPTNHGERSEPVLRYETCRLPQLRRQLDFFDATMIVMGGTVGSGNSIRTWSRC
jgi:hypothetical protein